MNVQDRMMRMIYVPSKNAILASDVKGRIHLLDLDLNLLRSSPTTSYNEPKNGLFATDRFVFTKDRRGSIARWDLETLQPLDIYDDMYLRDDVGLMEGEEPSPASNRGLAVVNGKVYGNNGYSQFAVIDANSFELLEIRKPFSANSFVDCINVECADTHAVSETSGLLHLGNLETGHFPITLKVDNNNVHWVRYDRRHDRFWATQDAGINEHENIRNGVITVEKDGTGLQLYNFTDDDIEFLEFDHESRYVYTGGFDGHIYVFDNTNKELRLNRIIGPFPYSIINMLYVSDDELYVLMQNGELVRSDRHGNITARTNYAGRCVWQMEPHPEDESLLYCALDDGVQVIRYRNGIYNSIQIDRIAQHQHAFGIIRRVYPFPDGSYAAIGRKNVVFRAAADGTLLWYRKVLGLPRSLSPSHGFDKLLVSTDDGYVTEFNAEDGTKLDEFSTGGIPVWACTYTMDGRRMFFTRNANLYVYAADSKELLHLDSSLKLFPKRFLPTRDGKMYVVGAFGYVELDLDTYEVKKEFIELLVNTKENGKILDGYAHVISYGYQLGSYQEEDGEMVGLIEQIQDFPKAMAGRIGDDGVPMLLVGGRGNFVNVYRVIDGVPEKVREFYFASTRTYADGGRSGAAGESGRTTAPIANDESAVYA